MNEITKCMCILVHVPYAYCYVYYAGSCFACARPRLLWVPSVCVDLGLCGCGLCGYGFVWMWVCAYKRVFVSHLVNLRTP